MAYPKDYRYTDEHEWVKVDGETALVGITDHAQDQLGDVVYVELPGPGDSVQAGVPFGTVESVKAVSDIYAPLSGEITAVNSDLLDAPERVNEDPHGEGWLVRIAVQDPDEIGKLMDAKAYASYVAAETEG